MKYNVKFVLQDGVEKKVGNMSNILLSFVGKSGIEGMVQKLVDVPCHNARRNVDLVVVKHLYV